jgi:hypothetical protein
MKAIITLVCTLFVLGTAPAHAFGDWYAVIVYDYDNKRVVLGPFSSASECQWELNSVRHQFIAIKRMGCIQQR